MTIGSVRRLTSADATTYRTIRLESLRLHPEAFGGSYQDELSVTREQTSAMLDRNTVFGWVDGAGTCSGVAGMFVRPAINLRHKAVLFGMFVHPDARKCGIGEALIAAIVDTARETVEELQLSVVASNTAAVRLY